MKLTTITVVFVVLFSSCKKEIAQTETSTCIDKSLINPSGICTMDYRPVCGCDGKTYSNACVAKNTAGVTSFKEGECGK